MGIHMVNIRRITALPILMKWRAEVLKEVFGEIPDARLLVANRQYYCAHIADGTHIAFVAESDGEECGCGSVCFSDELPSPDNPTGRCGLLMNIYVSKAFRNRGIAHSIVQRLVDESIARGCGKITLETTPAGRSVYLSMGFEDMHDVMKYYDTKH